jgi:hypothetical protein
LVRLLGRFGGPQQLALRIHELTEALMSEGRFVSVATLLAGVLSVLKTCAEVERESYGEKPVFAASRST